MVKPKALLASSLLFAVTTFGVSLQLVRTRHRVREAERYAGSAFTAWRNACSAVRAELDGGADVPDLIVSTCVPPDQNEHLVRLLADKQYRAAAKQIADFAATDRLPVVAKDRDVDTIDMPRGYAR